MTMSEYGNLSTDGPLAAAAGWAASQSALPMAGRAVLGYYARTGEFDLPALQLKRHVDDRIDAILSRVFAAVEANLADEFDEPSVSFSYETKLTLPAELTLGYLYRRAQEMATDVDPVTRAADGGLFSTARRGGGASAATLPTDEWLAVQYVERADALTELILTALLDGDMRDALNDEEYEDFVVNLPLDDEADRRRVAAVAQSTLETATRGGFDRYPDAVERAYDRAVDLSEGHQDQDEHFRALMAAATGGDEEALDSIEAEYKFRPFDDAPHPFTADECEIPYLKTQYDRVGVIYDGMLDMYQGAGFDIGDDFRKAILLAIVGAQIWLDDIDDLQADMAEGQLTPVTAEYLLAADDATARRRVVDLSETYFERAREYARAAESPLTGIAIEYILRSGDVDALPG
jgi:hypothetical protein